MRNVVKATVVFLVVGAFLTCGVAKGAMLVYEPFNYTAGAGTTLDGQSGGTGMTGSWTAANANTYPSGSPTGFAINDASTGTLWNGTVTSVPQTGNFAGSPAPAGISGSGYNGNNPDHMWAYRTLASTVTDNFTPGSTTWMSFVEASNFKANGNGTGGMLALGSTYFGTDTRGEATNSGTGLAIGMGILYPLDLWIAAVWDPSFSITSPYDDVPVSSRSAGWNTTGLAQIGITKIVWGDATTPTNFWVAIFNEGDVISEAAFDASLTLATNSATFNPSTFDHISLGGARFDVDEIRIATTFDEAIGIPEPATLALLAFGGIAVLRRRRLA